MVLDVNMMNAVHCTLDELLGFDLNRNRFPLQGVRVIAVI